MLVISFPGAKLSIYVVLFAAFDQVLIQMG
jgi:hypothetical protein